MITPHKAVLLLAAVSLSCSSASIAQTERMIKTPATKMEQAIIDARKSLSQRQSDPMMPLKQAGSTPAATVKKSRKKSRGWFVDPPPPVVPTGAINGIPVSQYGCANPYITFVAEKETLSDKVRLLAVMDGKVMISLPAGLRAKKNWPSTITMSEGEKFDSLAVIAVRRDSVTFEEDNKRYVKMLAPVQ